LLHKLAALRQRLVDALRQRVAGALAGAPAGGRCSIRGDTLQMLDGCAIDAVARRAYAGRAVVTMKTYAHMFEQTDAVAANAIEAALKGGKK
jgi:hypothetical protein